jgi:D-serine deaminase-like pyridoxal phosphate-dependent protein
MRKAAMILSLLLTVTGSMAWAHGAGQHVLGTVTVMGNGHLEVRTSKGETVSVELNDQTRYRSKGDPTRSLPQVGDRVVIDIAKSGQSLLAIEIQFSGKKKKSEAAK